MSATSAPGRVRIGRNLAIALVAFCAFLAVSFLKPFSAFNDSLLAYLTIVWWAVLLGLLVGGCIDYFVPNGFVIRFLGPDRRLAVVNAVFAGFLMSACSHGILAIAIELYKKGAGVPAVVAFLLSSPWANMPMTILLFGFFGWHAVLFVAGAMLIALLTGLAFAVLSRRGWIEGSAPSAASTDIEWVRLKHFQPVPAIRGVWSGTVKLANMVLWWIIVGILIAALIGAYVPQHVFLDYLGPDFLGVALTLLIASVIEVCSEGSSPIAFEIHANLGVLGNPFVFLMAGVATDYTEIGLIWTNIGRRAALWLPAIAVPQIVVLGLALNALSVG